MNLSAIIIGLITIVFSQLNLNAYSFLQPYVVADSSEKYVNGTSPLQRDTNYIRTQPALQYWKIMPHYESQLTNSSCSSTTMSMILNSFRYDFDLELEEGQNITQFSLVKNVYYPEWKKKTENDGGGVGLKKLKDYVQEALEFYGLQGFEVQMIQTKSEGLPTVNRIRELLLEIEKSKTDRLVFNFDQGLIFSQDSVGHFAPFGAYDRKTDRVLLMDPDRENYEPYWVPLNLMVRAMKNRGLLHLKYLDEEAN